MLATLGIYTSIVMLFKLKPSKKAVEAPGAFACADCRVISKADMSNTSSHAAASAAASTSSAIPSLFDDEFDEWSKLPGNLERWEKSLDTIGA